MRRRVGPAAAAGGGSGGGAPGRCRRPPPAAGAAAPRPGGSIALTAVQQAHRMPPGPRAVLHRPPRHCRQAERGRVPAPSYQMNNPESQQCPCASSGAAASLGRAPSFLDPGRPPGATFLMTSGYHKVGSCNTVHVLLGGLYLRADARWTPSQYRARRGACRIRPAAARATRGTQRCDLLLVVTPDFPLLDSVHAAARALHRSRRSRRRTGTGAGAQKVVTMKPSSGVVQLASVLPFRSRSSAVVCLAAALRSCPPPQSAARTLACAAAAAHPFSPSPCLYGC